MPKPGDSSKLKRFLFSNQSTAQTIAKNTFWLSFGEITGRFLRVAIIFYAARILGVAGYGTFSYMTNLAAIITVFSDVGLSSVLIREVAKNKEQRAALFSTSLALKTILVFFSLALILLGTPFITGIPISNFLIYAVAGLFLFDSLRRFGSSIFRAEERMELEAIINIFTQVVIVGAGFAMLILNPSPEALALAYALGAGLGFLATVYFLVPYVKNIFSNFDRSLVRSIVSAAWPMTIASIFGTLLVNIDTVMIGWFFDATQVGLYAAAQKPIAFFYLLPAFIVGGLFPALSRLAGKNVDKFKEVLERGLSMVMLMALPLSTGIFLTAEKISILFYGNEYLGSAPSLRVLSITLLITFPATILIHSFFAHDQQKKLVPLWIAGSVLNIFLNYLLIPVFGIVGAAWTSVIAQLAINGSLWAKAKELSSFKVLPRLGPTIKATLIMAAVVLGAGAVGFPFPVTLILAFLVYLGALIFFKDQTLAELTSILKGVRDDS
ncbi:MAG: flippase [Patescibacteria group bacterium]|nr:flippase [Patescibacteria group bacterium]